MRPKRHVYQHPLVNRGANIVPALVVDRLHAAYGESRVLHGVDLTVGWNEVMAVIGKNGMGKSTLLKAITGVLRPTSGEVHLFGEIQRRPQPFKLARRGVSYVAQERALFPDLTVEENITLALPADRTTDEAFDEIRSWFPVLAERRKQQAGTLSGGEQKMLLLARGLTPNPRLLLIDEITEGLQPSVREVLREVLREQQEQRGTSIVLVEQDLGFAFALADRFAVMKLGVITDVQSTVGADWRDVASQHLAL